MKITNCCLTQHLPPLRITLPLYHCTPSYSYLILFQHHKFSIQNPQTHTHHHHHKHHPPHYLLFDSYFFPLQFFFLFQFIFRICFPHKKKKIFSEFFFPKTQLKSEKNKIDKKGMVREHNTLIQTTKKERNRKYQQIDK